MSTQVDWQREIDTSFGDAPVRFDAEATVALGRRAVRKRRAGWAAGVLATVTVVGGVGWTTALGGSGTRADQATIAVDPPAQVENPSDDERSNSLLSFRRYTDPLVVLPGVSIRQRTDDVIDNPDVRSTAAVVTFEGREWWAMAAVAPSTGWGADTLAITGRTFDQWVSEMVALNTEQMFADGKHVPGWVTLGDDGRLTPHKGATIVEQATPARLDQAPAGVPSATAMIDVDGARLCAVARRIGDPDPEVFYFPESEYQGCGASLPGFAYGDRTGSQAP